MRKYFYLAILILALALAACSPKAQPSAPSLPTTTQSQPTESDSWKKLVEAAQKEGKLTAYSAFLGSAAVTGPVTAAFKAKYNINVEVMGVTGAVGLERVKSEHAGQKYMADTMDGNSATMLQAKDAGMLVPLSDLPALQEKDKWLTSPIFDPEKFIISMTPGMLTPYVNTSMVKAGDEPKSFMDFLDAKWKGGKIIVSPPKITGAMYFAYVTLVPKGILTDDYYIKLGKQGLFLTPNIQDSNASLGRGDAPLHFGGTSSFMATLYARGAPIKPIVMKEGTIYYLANPMTVLAKAPHPNAAKLFVNWMASQEGQEAFHKAQGDMSFRKDVPNFTAEALKVKPKKVFIITFGLQEETDRLTRLNYLDKLWGLE